MKLVSHINELLKKNINKNKNIVLFGQNINSGSCLSGLTKGLDVKKKNIIINTQNSENSLVGFGFGLMLQGISSIFFMKQLDFLLLSIDQLVNTYNIVRLNKINASFTIFPVTVDSGFEGPQSSLNNLDDFCSIAGIEGFSMTNYFDSQKIINSHLIKKGFRIITAGQKDLNKDCINIKPINEDQNSNFFQYKKGNLVTILCFSQSILYGLEFESKIAEKGFSSSLFSINSHSIFDYSVIFQDIERTKQVIIIDDTKSRNKTSYLFINDILEKINVKKHFIINRQFSIESLYPYKDTLDIDYQKYILDLIQE
jgi:pyruvate/2-oxoglutarate/acetoin dehydrogenase E1 component